MRGSPRFWGGLYLGCAAIVAFSTRYQLSHDGLSYLDLASEAVRSGPAALINGYWSPGYPALISLALFILRPSPGAEFPIVHLVNFLISAAALWAFGVFFRNWRAGQAGGEALTEDQAQDVTPFAFCTFLWFTLALIGTAIVTPDLAVAAVVLLAAGISCRLSLPGSTWKHFAALGVVLGIGYWFKTVMFPIALALFVLLFFLSPLARHSARWKLLLSVAVFLAVSMPLVAALSVRAKTPTIGETGRLNYLWFVNGLPSSSGWTGGSGDHGSPEHAPRTLMERPVVLEFAAPIKGTFPLWYDPSYWYAGAQASFNLRQQIVALKITLLEYKALLLDSMAFVAGVLVLCVLIAKQSRLPGVPRGDWWQLAWPLMVCAMYALVHVETRFLAPFLVLFWMALYRSLMFRVNRWAMVAVCATVLTTVMVPYLSRVATETARIVGDVARPRTPDYQTAAAGLRDLGVRAGDTLAIVGEGYDAYYAQYGRLRVVAEIPRAQEFWYLKEPDLKALEDRLASIGVKAVVAPDRPSVVQAGDWRDLHVSDSLRLSVLLLSPR